MRLLQIFLLLHLIISALTIFLIEYKENKTEFSKPKLYALILLIPVIASFIFWYITMKENDSPHVTEYEMRGEAKKDIHHDIGDPTG